jgi:hypothetical protein
VRCPFPFIVLVDSVDVDSSLVLQMPEGQLVPRRPERFSRRIVVFVEHRVRRLEYKIFVFLLDRFLHLIFRVRGFEVWFSAAWNGCAPLTLLR